MSAKQKSERLPGEKRPRIPSEAKRAEVNSPRSKKTSDRPTVKQSETKNNQGQQHKAYNSGEHEAKQGRSRRSNSQEFPLKSKPSARYDQKEKSDQNKAEKAQKQYPKRSTKQIPYTTQHSKRSLASQETDKQSNRSTYKSRKEPYRSKATEKKPLTGGIERRDKTEFIRLNKYLADAGICSRREADKYIQAGVVKVNDTIVTELGTKVSIHDKVEFEGQVIRREKLRYILLNKPKGYITTADDPYDRKTVMELIAGACEERVYPVGRLDRNTTGLLLLTNDGELTKKLTHPAHGASKLYHVWLDKPLTRSDLRKIEQGVELEDGLVNVDAVDYVADDESHKQIGIQIHSGRNRVVRRLFEHLGYEVVKLDRPMFAGLTKLKLSRGHWRFLTPAEISMLKRIR